MDTNCDRLSTLPDDVIFKILFFAGMKTAVQTSVLSSRWRYMWTLMPHLNFSSDDFNMFNRFYTFVTLVLSRRSNQIQLSSVKFHVHEMSGEVREVILQTIINSAFSLNVQQVNVTSSFGGTCFVSVPSSRTNLKHLALRSLSYNHIPLTLSSELSSLTTLQLKCITLYDGFLSKCPNLKTLTLRCCSMTGSNGLRICHPRLSNLTLVNADILSDNITVVTPQLKNLSVRTVNGVYTISAPELASLHLSGLFYFVFSTDADGFWSLQRAELFLHGSRSSNGYGIVSLLQKVNNVKTLSLSPGIIKLLNSSTELISDKPSAFANLKSLKILPENEEVFMSTEVKSYLLTVAGSSV